jgi:glycosyltransferase involved in cell wall biosynthesis
MDSSIAQQLVERMPFLKLLAPALNACERHAIRNAVACAPVCDALADVAHRAGAKHVETLHDISQLSAPCREPTGFLRERLGTADGRLLLMYVGNLQPYQGVDLLLAGYAVAIELGARVDLVIVGGSDAHIAAYRDRARSMGLDGQVHFLGRWPAAKLDELLVEADMLTAPRIKGVNTPQKIFPYMHSGRPVLLTDLPTHSQIVDGSVACLAPPNPEGFGRAIASLASDTERREALGAAGKAFVERNHTFPAHQRRVDRLYEYVAGELQRRPAGTVGRRRLIDHPTEGEG